MTALINIGFIKKSLIVLSLTLMMPSAWAQNSDEFNNREIFMMGLYPPDMIMRQQQRLGISSEQRGKITGYVKEFQQEVTELQWSMPAEKQSLVGMLAERPIAQDAVLDQATKVLNMESEFKRSHIKLLVSIKNVLTEEQITQLDRAIRTRVQNIRERQ